MRKHREGLIEPAGSDTVGPLTRWRIYLGLGRVGRGLIVRLLCLSVAVPAAYAALLAVHGTALRLGQSSWMAWAYAVGAVGGIAGSLVELRGHGWADRSRDIVPALALLAGSVSGVLYCEVSTALVAGGSQSVGRVLFAVLPSVMFLIVSGLWYWPRPVLHNTVKARWSG